MISKDSLTPEWLEKASRANRRADKTLVEKVIRALLLLEGLASSKLKFTFKGGTALMLLLGSTKRLSIDIDIIVSEKQDLDEIFDSFIAKKWFIRYELQKRHTVTDIKKAHYKFFYNPIYRTSMAEDYVLLDILFEHPHYSRIIEMPIESAFVLQDGMPAEVSVPCPEDILGDKLTAFAPNTTGIPYVKGADVRSMEIIKQLYDVGSLITVAVDTTIVSNTFKAFAKTELGYRNIGSDHTIVLDDIYQTALHICTRGEDGRGEIGHLTLGINQVKQYIFSEGYNYDKAITDASKAAYVAKTIEYNIESLEKFKDAAQIKDLIIDAPFHKKIQQLKKSNPEAFFYWYQIHLLEKESKRSESK